MIILLPRAKTRVLKLSPIKSPVKRTGSPFLLFYCNFFKAIDVKEKSKSDNNFKTGSHFGLQAFKPFKRYFFA